MKIKKCQLNMNCPCCDRGQACLKTEKEKKEFNDKLTRWQKYLERAKFVLDKHKG